MTKLRIAFAGDRDISVWVLRYLLEQGVQPLALFVSDTRYASHADKLIELCPVLGRECILIGKTFRESEGLELLRQLNLDYIIGIHFPYIFPPEVLDIPKIGILNLHPAYLPYNRGWHTPTWSILEDTPIGATLHFMDASVDTGDIVHQKELDIKPDDTADSLYQCLKHLELEVFQEAWLSIANETYCRQPQDPGIGTMHKRADLFSSVVQELDLNETVRVSSLLKRLRALTTSRLDEAAYFEVDGVRYRVQVVIQKETDAP